MSAYRDQQKKAVNSLGCILSFICNLCVVREPLSEPAATPGAESAANGKLALNAGIVLLEICGIAPRAAALSAGGDVVDDGLCSYAPRTQYSGLNK